MEINFQDKKAIIYDFDNTLVSTDKFVQEHILETAEKLRITKIKIEDIEKIQKENLAFEEIFKRLFDEESDKVLAEYRKTALSKPYSATYGAIDFVKYLESQGFIQGIITNRTNMIEQRIEQAHLPKFSFILSTQSGIKKPHPEALNPAIEYLSNKQISKKETISIGDHTDDFLSSKAAGIDFIAILTGQSRSEDFIDAGLQKNHIFNSFEELLKMIRQKHI